MSSIRFWPLAALALACSSACSDSETILEQPTPPAGGDEPTVSPAIMIVGQIYSPEGYNTYVGVLPEIPQGEVDFASFRELGNANVFTSGGYVFVEEDGIMQRFSVDDDLRLVDGPRFSWQDFGIGEINATSTVFVSPERAYSFAPGLDVVIVWNPETMERTGNLDVGFPERPDGMETFATDGYVVGDKVIWNVFSGNWDTITPYPAVTLVIADAEDDEPVRVVEDDRCLPGGPASVDDEGNYYVQAGAFYGYFMAYGDVASDARTCVLRVNAGEGQPDPDFLIDYQELTGSYVSDPWFNISGDQFFARSWDPEVAFPDPEHFYDNAALRPLIIDISEGTTRPYPDLSDVKTIDGVTRIVDGVSYFQLSQTGYVENGNTDVVELREDGIVPRFHLNGFLLGLDRVR